ncbi:hypothetical protein E4T66_07265 [Sinimarinibacterium sp. CAU 1509]|uniref:hypothetical protein n=1 Tax=Sinimarinibacterium sp. CAU 1509 TaxID=2562283 RepID=UPI0010ABCE33|nr:hypothetical protein [Sinimarinibacterium sp. CAU 1509]TJY62031.1 hypothetical protein E4T66_07265 [Sinimarinibacterium sp. CAU 1509]
MKALPSAVTDALVQYLDWDDAAALDQACALASTQPLEINALLSWVATYRCDPALRAQATRSLRAALGLTGLPGAVCRTPGA